VIDASSSHCTTRLENAHGTAFQELLYPWQPWFGLRLDVHRAIDRPEGLTFRCSLRGSDADRWVEVAAWDVRSGGMRQDACEGRWVPNHVLRYARLSDFKTELQQCVERPTADCRRSSVGSTRGVPHQFVADHPPPSNASNDENRHGCHRTRVSSRMIRRASNIDGNKR
jgi:hypothetical protein